ncbi:MAG TPA: hypothetical protein VMI73_02225 [Trebonia sp.]|nr:hypothetical protein [Trebonia sp.]
MGVTSGRGGRGGGRHGNDGGRDSGYRGVRGDGAPGHRAGRQQASGYGDEFDHAGGQPVYGSGSAYGDRAAAYGERAGAYHDGRPVYGHGLDYADGGYGDGHGNGDQFAGERQATAFTGGGSGRRTSGRRARPGRRRGAFEWLRDYPAPVLSVVAIVACAALVAAGIGVNRMLTAAPAADASVNANCTLIVPANPLTAQGLATPYQLTATNPADGPCDEANGGQTAFVQGAVIDPATGQISVYDPLVVNAGTQPAVAPVLPTLPANAVVALWFGYNGDTLTLAGADENLGTTTATASAPADAATPTDSASPTDTGGTATSTATATPTATDTGAAAATATVSDTTGATQSGAALAAQDNQGNQGTQGEGNGAARASLQSVGSAPMPPSSYSSSGLLNASVTSVVSAASGNRRHQSPAPTASASGSTAPTASASASGTAVQTSTATPTATAPTATATATPTASATANPANGPAAAPVADAILQQAGCVAGQDFGGQFSSFTQVGACNAAAFFTAANAAISAGKLTVPSPGTAKDGLACMTTRSFALIDQDQSDNVTSEYLSSNGQIAQDNAANRSSLGGADVLFNGSDNGLLDLFVDPALGCSPWQVPNLADAGAPTTALPLDELQAAVWAGRNGSGPAALVPLNDPMTLDDNGNTSTDKTNTYRSLADMSPLPAGQSPATYCADMESIQGRRLQQDVNLFMNGPSPDPGAASNLFMFLAMRLQQSYANLNCGSFGIRNVVSTTADGNGVVVAACFLYRAAPRTAGPGNPTAGHRHCPATTGGQASASTPAQGGTGTGQPSSSPSPTGMSRSGVKRYYRHHHHG